MRNALIIFVFNFMTISTLYAAETAAQKENSKIAQEIGRFQLFQGSYTTLDLKYSQASSTHNAVFLLDTATGVVKRYVNRIDEDGRYIETWLTTDLIQPKEPKKTPSPKTEGK